jgi:hypothetical protein
MTPAPLICISLPRACLRQSWQATATTTRCSDSSSNNSDSNKNHSNNSTPIAASKITTHTTAADKTTTNTNMNIHTNTRVFSTTTKNDGTTTYASHKTVPTNPDDDDHLKELMGQPLQKAASPLWGPNIVGKDKYEE